MTRSGLILILLLVQASFAQLCLNLSALGQGESGGSCAPLGGGEPISASYEIYDSQGQLVGTAQSGANWSGTNFYVPKEGIYTVYASSAAGFIPNSPKQTEVYNNLFGGFSEIFTTCNELIEISGIVQYGENTLQSEYVNTNSGQSAQIGRFGLYRLYVPFGWSGSISLPAGYDSFPEIYTFTSVTSNKTGYDFNVQPATCTITGTITRGDRPVANADILASTGEAAKSGADGTYELSVPRGFSGTIRALCYGLQFQPAEHSLTNVTDGQSGVDFSAITYTVGGVIKLQDDTPLGGVKVRIAMTSGTDTVLTDSEGLYKAYVPYLNHYTIKPFADYIEFNPSYYPVAQATEDKLDRHFTATLSPDFPLLDVHVLSPASVCVLWDDSSNTNTEYKLDVIRWRSDMGLWSDSIKYTLPGDYSAFCVNDLQPDSYYLFQLYSINQAGEKVDTLRCFQKTITQADITDTDLYYYLPYAPVSGFDGNGALNAHTFLYSWSRANSDTLISQYLLLKRPEGHFSIYKLHEGDVSNSFMVTDIEVVDNEVYVAHTEGDLFRVTLVDENTTQIRPMALNLGGGFPAKIERKDNTLYMALRLPEGQSGAIPALGMYDMSTETLALKSHAGILMGADLISIGPNGMIWLADNFASATDDIFSNIVAIDLNADPLFQNKPALTAEQSRHGIIDMKANPITGELVYLSPLYGFCGSFGTSYNKVLELPGGITNDQVGSFVFDGDGELVIRDKDGHASYYTSSSYYSIVSDAPLNWEEYIVQTNGLLENTTTLAILGSVKSRPEFYIGGLILSYAVYQLVIRPQTLSSMQVADFNLKVRPSPIVKEDIEVNMDIWRRALKNMQAFNDLDPNSDPGKHPSLKKLAFFVTVFALVQIATSAKIKVKERTLDYDLALGKTIGMFSTLAGSGYNDFIAHMRARGFIIPTDKKVIDYFNWGDVLDPLDEYSYMLENAYDFYGIDPDKIKYWSDIPYQNTHFNFFAHFAEKIHFLFKGVDLHLVINAEKIIDSAVPTGTEWELQIIKNNPYLLQKLACYDYVPVGPVRTLNLLGYCEACLQPDLAEEISDLYSDLDLKFVTDPPPVPRAKSTMNRTLATESTVLSIDSELFSQSQQSYLSASGCMVWPQVGMQATEIQPLQTDGTTSHFEIGLDVLGSFGELDFYGTVAPQDTMHSWFYYQLYQNQEIIDSVKYSYDPQKSYFIPDPDFRTTASTCLYGISMHNLIEEPADLHRYSESIYLTADASIQGKIYFQSPGDEVSALVNLTVYYKTDTGWIPLTTQTDASGEYFTAQANQDGIYALFGEPRQTSSIALTGRVLPHGLLTATGTCQTTLSSQNVLPDSSPYTNDSFLSETIPDTLSDWIWIEVRAAMESTPLAQTSALISQNGLVCDLAGNQGVQFDLPDGNYIVVVGHRNHAAIRTDQPLSFTAGTTLWHDFTENSCGATNDHLIGQLPDNRQVMLAGDINGDQEINTKDYVVWYNTTRQDGLDTTYHPCDLNGDGLVDDKDYDLWSVAASHQAACTLPTGQ